MRPSPPVRETTISTTPKDDEPTRVLAPPGADERSNGDGDGRVRERPPRLAEGVELAGRYEDSGYEDPPYIARRSDGQMIQLPALLYLIAEEADGRRGYDEVAERVTERFGRGLSAENVRMLAEKKLRPLGVLAQADGSSPRLRKLDPLLALRFRAALVPERAVQVVASAFSPLFLPPVIVAVLAALAAFDVWLFFVHGVAQSTRSLLYTPLWMLVVLGLVVVGTAWHEVGHASALRYGGGRPGAMGAGIYVVWPAFYTDVTDAYRLGRWGRIRTDLGGVYFNAIFVLAIGGLYLLTGIEPLLIAAVLVHLQVLQQFIPFLRLDGYYLVSDLTGVPDLFARIKPTLKSALPGGDDDGRAAELKPWVRRVTTGWVLLMLPVLALVFGMIVFNAPRMFATGWDSFWVQADALADAFGGGKALSGIAHGLQAAFLVLPLAGITYTLSKAGWRLGAGAWSWSADAPVRRAGVVAVAVAAAAVGAYVLLPNGDYRPIQRGERGTIQAGVAQFRSVPTGRPGLTQERERQLGEIVEERRSPAEDAGSGDEQAPAEETPGGTTATTETSTEPAATTETTTTTTTTGTTPTATTTTATTTTTTTATTTTTTTTTETTP